MNLKPINPYYRWPEGRDLLPARRTRKVIYSYPYLWQEPVTDRSQEDVEYARRLLALKWEELDERQKEEYLAGLKGCLNREDLERLENDIRILLDVLEIGPEGSVAAVPDIPDGEYFRRMMENIASIRRTALCIHDDTPQVPELPYSTWQKLNDIERILRDVYEVARSQFCYYIGEIYAGDTVGAVL